MLQISRVRKRKFESPLQETTAKKNNNLRKQNKKKSAVENKKSDDFCWICHEAVESEEIYKFCCPDCLKSYHNKCKVNYLRNSICECQWKSSDGNSSPLRHVHVRPVLNRLLDIVCSKIDSVTNMNLGDLLNGFFPKLYELDKGNRVFERIDLVDIIERINKKIYETTGRFYQDIKLILHNAHIISQDNSSDVNKYLRICQMFQKAVKEQLASAEGCPECYLSGIFTKVCVNNPHEIIWAKLKGYTFWPAKVLRIFKKNKVDVCFFHTHDRAIIPTSNVYKISEDHPEKTTIKQVGLKRAIEELEIYILNFEDVYHESFKYFPKKTPLDFRTTERYQKIKNPLKIEKYADHSRTAIIPKNLTINIRNGSNIFAGQNISFPSEFCKLSGQDAENFIRNLSEVRVDLSSSRIVLNEIAADKIPSGPSPVRSIASSTNLPSSRVSLENITPHKRSIPCTTSTNEISLSEVDHNRLPDFMKPVREYSATSDNETRDNETRRMFNPQKKARYNLQSDSIPSTASCTNLSSSGEDVGKTAPNKILLDSSFIPSTFSSTNASTNNPSPILSSSSINASTNDSPSIPSTSSNTNASINDPSSIPSTSTSANTSTNYPIPSTSTTANDSTDSLPFAVDTNSPKFKETYRELLSEFFGEKVVANHLDENTEITDELLNELFQHHAPEIREPENMPQLYSQQFELFSLRFQLLTYLNEDEKPKSDRKKVFYAFVNACIRREKAEIQRQELKQENEALAKKKEDLLAKLNEKINVEEGEENKSKENKKDNGKDRNLEKDDKTQKFRNTEKEEKDEHHRLKQSLRSRTQQLAEKEKGITSLKESDDNLEKKKEILKKEEIELSRSSNKKLSKEYNDLKKKVADMIKQNEILKKRCEAANRDDTKDTINHFNLQVDYEKHQKEIANLEKQNEILRVESENIKKEATEIRSDGKKLSEDLCDLKVHLSGELEFLNDFIAKINPLKKDKIKLVIDSLKLRADCEQYLKKIADLQNQHIILYNKNFDLKKVDKYLKKQIENVCKKHEVIKEKKMKLENNYQKLCRKRRRYQKMIDNLRIQNKYLTEEKADVDLKVEDVTSRNFELAISVPLQVQNMCLANDQNITLEMEIGDLKEKNKKLQNENELLRNEEKNLKSTKTKINEEFEALKTKFVSLFKQRQQLRMQNEMFQEVITKRNQRSAEFKTCEKEKEHYKK